MNDYPNLYPGRQPPSVAAQAPYLQHQYQMTLAAAAQQAFNRAQEEAAARVRGASEAAAARAEEERQRQLREAYRAQLERDANAARQEQERIDADAARQEQERIRATTGHGAIAYTYQGRRFTWTANHANKADAERTVDKLCAEGGEVAFVYAAHHAWMALAIGPSGAYGYASATTKQPARHGALVQCQRYDLYAAVELLFDTRGNGANVAVPLLIVDAHGNPQSGV